MSLLKEKLDEEMLYKLNSKLKEPRRDEVPEEQKVKRLTFKKFFTRGLLGTSEMLVNDVENKSGAEVGVIRSGGEDQTVVLRGTSKSVDKAEEMLNELLSSAQEISLSWEDK